MDKKELRAKEFLYNLGHGKNFYRQEEEQEQEIEIPVEEKKENKKIFDDGSNIDYNNTCETEKEFIDNELEESKETIRLSFDSREIFISSNKCSLNDVKKMIIELLKETEIKDFLRLNMDKTNSSSYLG